jgi:ADYC domain
MMWSRNSTVRYLISSLAALAAGCPTPPSLGPPVSPPLTQGTTCGTWLCQTNAASVGNGLFFHELDVTGTKFNDAGIRYVPGSFHSADGVPLELSVRSHDLVGTNGGPLGSLYQRQNLKGAMLVLESQTGETFDVRIAEVDFIDFWVHPGRELIPTYTFEYRVQKGSREFRPMCTGRDLSREWAERGEAATLALVFTGDRYDAQKKTVATGPSDWFNVACAGSAVAKMHLLRHTTAGIVGTSSGILQTAQDERQAMLKMLTDDICGTGYSFTVDGEDVLYMDMRRWHPFATASAGTLEAIWSKDGALCLEEPRRLQEDPSIAADIASECKPRPVDSCKAMGYDLGNWDSAPDAYGVSANPP